MWEKYPFDIQIYSAGIEEDFAREKAVIEEEVTVSQYYAYHIYTDGQNHFLILRHLSGILYRDLCGIQVKCGGKKQDKKRVIEEPLANIQKMV